MLKTTCTTKGTTNTMLINAHVLKIGGYIRKNDVIQVGLNNLLVYFVSLII